MPLLIKDGALTDDAWLPPVEGDTAAEGHICTLAQWQSLEDKKGAAVQLEPGDTPAELYADLADCPLVAINFPVFTDGRGFSYARELREQGFTGELRAVGHFIRDQLTYLTRVGFNSFQMDDESLLEPALASLSDLREFYQASADQPLPLFRRRA